MSHLENPKNKENLKSMFSELNDTVEQTFYLEQKIKEWQKIVDANKAKISKAIGNKKRINVRVDKYLGFEVLKDVNPSISFYADQLRSNLDKGIYDRTVNRTIVVSDLEGLKKLLKSNGIKPKEFKNYIKTVDEVSAEKIESLIDLGELEIKDLQGCYTAEFNEDIRVKRLSR